MDKIKLYIKKTLHQSTDLDIAGNGAVKVIDNGIGEITYSLCLSYLDEHGNYIPFIQIPFGIDTDCFCNYISDVLDDALNFGVEDRWKVMPMTDIYFACKPCRIDIYYNGKSSSDPLHFVEINFTEEEFAKLVDEADRYSKAIYSIIHNNGEHIIPSE